jgi:hypothetical protein
MANNKPLSQPEAYETFCLVEKTVPRYHRP